MPLRVGDYCVIAHIIGITVDAREIFRLPVPPSFLEDTAITNHPSTTAQVTSLILLGKGGKKDSLEEWGFGMKVLSLFEDEGLTSAQETRLLHPRMMTKLTSGASNAGSATGYIANIGQSIKRSISTKGPQVMKWFSSMKMPYESDAESMTNGEEGSGNRPATPKKGVIRSISDKWRQLSFSGKSDKNREAALGKDASTNNRMALERKDSKGDRKKKRPKVHKAVRIDTSSDNEVGGDGRKKKSGSRKFDAEHDVAINSGGESDHEVGVDHLQRSVTPPSRGTTPPPSPQKGPSPQPSPKKGSTPPPSPQKGPSPQPSPKKGSTPPPSPQKGPSPQPSPKKGSTPPPSSQKGPSPQPSPQKGPSPQPSPKKGSTPPPSPPKGPTPQSTPKKSPPQRQKSRSPSPTGKQSTPPPSPPHFSLPPAQVRSESPERQEPKRERERQEPKRERERSRSPAKIPPKTPASYTGGWSSGSLQAMARRAEEARKLDEQRRAAGLMGPTGRQKPISSSELGGGTTWVASSYGEIPPTIGFVQKEAPKTDYEDWAKYGYNWGKYGKEKEAPIQKPTSPPRSRKLPSPARREPPPATRWELSPPPPPPRRSDASPPPSPPKQAPTHWQHFKPPKLPDIVLEEEEESPNFDYLCEGGQCSIVYKKTGVPAHLIRN
nr:PREDICTED: basic salivary proline-rich protein 2-like [Bemisia tabaci]